MTKFLPRLAYLLIVIVLCAGSAFSQNNIKSKILDGNGNPRFIQLESAVEFNSKSSDFLKQTLNLEQNESFVLNRYEDDKLGQSHYRYQQYFNGVKVEHGNYIVHAKGTKATSLNGDYKKIPQNLNVEPSLSESQALTKALAYVGANEYMWESTDNEEFAKQTEPAKTFYPKGELVIVENNLSESKAVRSQLNLAYKFNIYAAKPVSRAFIYVNAITGEIESVNAIIKNAAEIGSADTRYSGTKSIATDSYNSSYRLRDFTRGGGIETYDCNEGTSYTRAVDFTDTDNNWTAAEYDNADKDNGALDAHWAGLATYDYFNNTHNRNSFDGNGAAVKAYVHYSSNYDNAYWNGSVLTFGDGSSFDILTSLDVYGHEFGHAVCSYTANLAYQNESGALNEAFSDIWGCVIEFYNAPEKDTWLMGEDLGTALRSLVDPKSKGLPDTYMGENWFPLASRPTSSNDYGGVHYNNGPFCHWFYLLSEGGSGTNDNGDSYSISSIGIDKAEKIAYRVESVYMTSSSDYADARTYSIQAAIDFYGAGSNEEMQVTNAMYAIGVGAAYEGGVPVDDTEAPTVPTNLTSSNITSSSVNLAWTAATDNIGVTGYDIYKDNVYYATTASTGYSVTGLNASTSYSFYVKAKDAAGNLSAASNTANVTTSEIVIGEDAPMISAINISSVTSGRRYYVTSTINVTSGGNPVSNAYVEFTWSGSYTGTVSGYTDASGNFSSTTAKIKYNSVTVTINDITATGYYWDMAASEVTDSYNTFALMPTIEAATYPNPCTSEVNFVIEQDNASNAIINLFDITGKQVVNKQVEMVPGFNTIQLDINNLEKGIYIYRISTDEGTTKGKIVKK